MFSIADYCGYERVQEWVTISHSQERNWNRTSDYWGKFCALILNSLWLELIHFLIPDCSIGWWLYPDTRHLRWTQERERFDWFLEQWPSVQSMCGNVSFLSATSPADWIWPQQVVCSAGGRPFGSLTHSELTQVLSKSIVYFRANTISPVK